MSMDQNPEFVVELMKELVTNTCNFYGLDNWDPDRFGTARQSIACRLALVLNKLLATRGICFTPRTTEGASRSIESVGDLLEGVDRLYHLLEDEYSKALLVKLIAYRILGSAKVKLPTNTAQYWEGRSQVLGLASEEDIVKLEFMNWSLHRFQLHDVGYPVSVYSTAYGALRTFVLKQYEYRSSTQVVKAQPGDYVIDAGACWGDTALYLAQEVGERGMVFSFEFVPSNLKVMYRNLDLNPTLSTRVTVVEHPLWRASNTILYCSDNGPGTRVGSEQMSADDIALGTLSIDEFSQQYRLSKVDFIKMDIEGTELEALQGASETIIQHRPTLAISVYHRLSDLVEIPQFLVSLGCRYRFFLDHFSIHHEETILFAEPCEESC